MEAIVNNLIKATGWSIFHSLWQGAIIYGLLFLTVMAIPKLKAKLKHNLAYGALCLIFICFCITFFSIFKLPFTTDLAKETELTINALHYEYLHSIPQEISSRTEQMFPYIVGVYGLGILGQLLILLAGYRRMHQLKYTSGEPVPEQWAAVFQEMSAKLNLKQHIGFFLSPKVNVPLVIGYFKPVVLFPIALATQLDIKQVEAILIHELSHIRRNDYLLNVIKTGIETLLFFNPFVWLSGRFINIEREHACDDLVVQLTGTPVTYAHALLKLEILKNKSTPALSMAATGKNQHLYQRIKRITDMKTNYMNAKQQIFAITLTIATVISLAWIKPAKAEESSAPIAVSTKNMEIAGLGIKFRHNEQATPANTSKLPVICSDTTKKKHKFKMVLVDANGTKKEYNSIDEVPDSLRNEVMNNTFTSFPQVPPFPMNPHMDSIVTASVSFMKSPEWQKNIAMIQKNSMAMAKQFNSPEWKKQYEDVAKNAGQVAAKYFQSPEWKKQIAEMQKNGEAMAAYFQSPEWKKQQQAIEEQAENMNKQLEREEWKSKQADLQKRIADVKARLHSNEFRKAEQKGAIQSSPEYGELEQKFNESLQKSAEYKKIKQQFEKDVEALKKKKQMETEEKISY